jgi:hypothetical protein
MMNFIVSLLSAILVVLSWAWEVDDRRPQRIFLNICFVLILLLMAVTVLWRIL